MARTPDDYWTVFAEAITVLDGKLHNQNEAQSKQASEIEEIKRKVVDIKSDELSEAA